MIKPAKREKAILSPRAAVAAHLAGLLLAGGFIIAFTFAIAVLLR